MVLPKIFTSDLINFAIYIGIAHIIYSTFLSCCDGHDHHGHEHEGIHNHTHHHWIYIFLYIVFTFSSSLLFNWKYLLLLFKICEYFIKTKCSSNKTDFIFTNIFSTLFLEFCFIGLFVNLSQINHPVGYFYLVSLFYNLSITFDWTFL